MISRLIARLDAEIGRADNPLTADCLLAEQACHYARSGNRGEVRRILLELHGRYRRPQPLMSAWLHLVEALDIFYSDMGPKVADKLQRAHAVSQAYGFQSLQARTAAWLGHWFYSSQQFERMAASIMEALGLVQISEHSTLSRVCLVVAEALHLSGEEESASTWYTRAHKHAISDGDEITTSAIIYNRSSIELGRIRNASLQGVSASHKPDFPLAEGESARNLDLLLGSLNFDSFSPLLRAQGLALRGDIEEALSLYKDNVERSKLQGLGRLQSWLLADTAWCYAIKGESALARAYCVQSASALDESDHVDDRAATYTRLAQISEIEGDGASANTYREEANVNWQRFAAMHTTIREHLASVEDAYEALPTTRITEPQGQAMHKRRPFV
jgi:tetratricopeptide (TPR) repeat protein